MKVALITEWLKPSEGGVASHVRYLAQGLDKKGIDTVVVTNKTDDDFSFELPVRMISGPKDGVFQINISPFVRSSMKKIFLEEKVDIVHCHHAFARLPLAGIYMADDMDIPCVLTTHTVSMMPDNDYLWQAVSYSYPRYRMRLSKVDKIIAVSESARRFIGYFADENKTVVIPNGVDINRFKPSDEEKTGKTILYVGRLAPKKGLHVLIRAMKDVTKKHQDVALLIGGTGKLRLLLKNYAKVLGVEDNIRFLGYVKDKKLPSLYSSSDVFVLPSITSESFGITLLEAMASGVPPIGTRVGGIPRIIKDCGVLVKPNDSKALARAIIKLLDDDNLRNDLAEKSRRRAEDEYSWDKVIDRVIQVYTELEEK